MKFLPIFFAIALTACGPTKYRPLHSSGGFMDTQISQDIFHVEFSGNAYTNKDRALQFALLRSAEVALNNNYRYFIILNTKDYTISYTEHVPIVASHFSHTSIISGGYSYQVNKPRFLIVIKCFQNQPKGIVIDNEFMNKAMLKGIILDNDSIEELIISVKKSNDESINQTESEDRMIFDAEFIKRWLQARHNIKEKEHASKKK